MDENQNEMNNVNQEPISGGYGPINSRQSVYDDVVGTPTGGSNGMAIASLVCGILSIVGGCCIACTGYILAITGIVLGVTGKNKADEKGKKMATAGIICGIVGLVLSIINSVLGVIYNSQIYSSQDYSVYFQ